MARTQAIRKDRKALRSHYVSLEEESFTYIRSVLGLTSLTHWDVCDILARTPRPLGRFVRYVVQDELLQAPELDPGYGIIFGFEASPKGSGHVVSIYRCWGGQYIYFDSQGLAPHGFFCRYVSRNNIPVESVTVPGICVQHQGIKTCAYHALTFLDFAISNHSLLPQDLMHNFVLRLGPNSEETAILSVVKILSEYRSTVQITAKPDDIASSRGLILQAVNDNQPQLLYRLVRLMSSSRSCRPYQQVSP